MTTSNQDHNPEVPDLSEHGWSRFQILSLDGGGAKALFSAHVLADLEDDLNIRVVDHFDLITGTSAGGIVALGLGAGLSPREIADRFGDLVDRVFPRQLQRRARPTRLTRPAYNDIVLRDVLVEVLGDRTLGDSTKRLVIPSWDLQRGEVHIFKTRHHDRLTRDHRIKMVDVAMATTAAPTYFPAAHVSHSPLVDGGLWANNPSVLGIGEAVSMFGVALNAIRVLNIGTMQQSTGDTGKLQRGGLARWGRAAPGLIMEASSKGGIGTARHLIGFANFERFDAEVPPKKFALDHIESSAVRGHAASISRFNSPTFRSKFQDHRAEPFVSLPLPGAAGSDDAARARMTPPPIDSQTDGNA